MKAAGRAIVVGVMVCAVVGVMTLISSSRIEKVSAAQQKAAGAALAAKRGDQKVSDLKGASKSMYKSMREDQLEDFASTKRKPEHVG